MLLELLQLDKGRPISLSRQLTEQLIQLIRQGVISPGYRLPGSRQIAAALHIHRKTVIASLDQLVSEGWLETAPGKGTFVSAQLNATPDHLDAPASIARMAPDLTIPQTLKRNLYLTTQSLHLDDGLPDPRLSPVTELARAYKSVLTRGNLYTRYTYADTKGSSYLRAVLSDYLLETRGIRAEKEDIIITRGVTQALYLCIQTFLRPGDHVAVGKLNWESANANFLYHGMELVPVNVDEDGMDVDHLEELLPRYPVRMVYLTPHHQYPTTVIMPAARRIKLIDLARKYGFYIFEDDYDYDFHYTAQPVMPLASVDHGGFVLYAGSFTKAISPVFRVGYMIAKSHQIDVISRIRRMIDRQGDTLLELVIGELLEQGIIQRYLRKNRKIYSQRRDFFAELLTSELGQNVRFKLPEGGMSIWTQFDPAIDLTRLAQKALLQDLYISPGIQIASDLPTHATRLGFASSDETELLQAVGILKNLIG